MRLTRRQLKNIILRELRMINERSDQDAMTALQKKLQEEIEEKIQAELMTWSDDGIYYSFIIEWSTNEKGDELEGGVNITSSNPKGNKIELEGEKADSEKDAKAQVAKFITPWLKEIDWKKDYPELVYRDLFYVINAKGYQDVETQDHT